MAIQNYLANWVQSITDAVSCITGIREHFLQNTVNVLSSDNNTSTYIVFKNVPFNARFRSIHIENDALTSGTSYSLGIFDSQTGAAIAANALANAFNLTVAHSKYQNTTAANSALDGLAALTHDNSLQPLYQIAGLTFAQGAAKGTLDIVMTANAAGSTTGKVTFRAELLPPG